MRNAFFPHLHLRRRFKFIQDFCYLLVSETVFQCDTTGVKRNLNKRIWLFFRSHVVTWDRNLLAIMSKAHPFSSAYGWGGASSEWRQPGGQICLFEHIFHHSLALDNWELLLMGAGESNVSNTQDIGTALMNWRLHRDICHGTTSKRHAQRYLFPSLTPSNLTGRPN